MDHPLPPDASDAAAPGEIFSVGAAFNLGGAAFAKCYWPLVAVAAIGFGIGSVRYAVGMATDMVAPLSSVVLSALVEWPLYPGMAYVGICAVRDGKVRVEDVFLGYRCYGRSLLLGLLLAVAFMVGMIPGGLLLGGWLFVSISLGFPHVITILVAILLGLTRARQPQRAASAPEPP